MKNKKLFIILLISLLITSGYTQEKEASKESIVTTLQKEANTLAPLIKTSLGKQFLAEVPKLNPNPNIPKIFYNKSLKKAHNASEFLQRVKDTVGYKSLDLNTKYYYYTRYGTPLAFVLPIEILGSQPELPNKPLNLVDYGFGSVGHLKLLTLNGHSVSGIEVDPILKVLYQQEDSVNNNMNLVYGIFPKEKLLTNPKEHYDVFISKNTLKKGYVNPIVETAKKYRLNFGVSDSEYLKAVYNLLKPKGYFLIYNLHGKLSKDKETYKPWADGRSPFSKAQYNAAGFGVIAFNTDDTEAARKVGIAFGWDKQMDFKKHLYATYTLLQKLGN